MLALGAAIKALSVVATTISAVRTLASAISGVATAVTGVPAALGSVAAALRGVAAAGAAFLASPLGKIFSGLAVEFGTTSFEPQDDARKQLIANYGYDYWRYLKGRHPGTMPYSFNPGEGDLTPSQYRNLHPTPQGAHFLQHGGGGFGPPTPRKVELHVRVDVKGGSGKEKVQLAVRKAGAYHTTPFFDIPAGSYSLGLY
jgi:hypothetical protein